MTQVRVRPYIRRRGPRQQVLLKYTGLQMFKGSLGETTKRGQSYVFLREHTELLEDAALLRARELKEAHFRDEVIETMIHESLHATFASEGLRRKIDEDFARRGYGWDWGKRAEEELVDSITRETMEDIRELPRLVSRRPYQHRRPK